ncbi:MAG: MFS transporter, partial [Gammaproteobacteria bacterium]
MTINYAARQPGDIWQTSRLIPCPQRNKPWILATAILGSSLAFIEGSVVNLALPALQSGLNTSSSDLQWVMNAYLLMLGAFMLIGGSLGDRFGLRRIFILGTCLFGGGALACVFMPTLASLISARVIQGLGGALLVPTSLALIGSHFSEAERGRAIGIWAGASALTTALGPVLGGWVVDIWGWRAVFMLVPPVAALTILIAWWRVPASPALKHARLDFSGAVLLIAALILLIHALVNPGKPLYQWTSITLAILLGTGFIWREHRAASPMLPLGLF